MKPPAISVVIPAYNRAEFLLPAMGSIRSQAMPGLEVLLIDDGSEDGLDAAARQHASELRYLRQNHAGPSAARNHGVREASGDYLAFLDIDDQWTPGQLSGLHEALRRQPQAGIAQGWIRQVVEAPDGTCWQSGAYRMPYLGSFLFRRWVFEKCGMFDETMRRGEDYDFLVRCWENDVPKIQVDAVSLLYRRHAGNMTSGNNQKEHLLVLKRRMERIKAGLVDPAASRLAPFQTYIGDLTAWNGQKRAAVWVS